MGIESKVAELHGHATQYAMGGQNEKALKLVNQAIDLEPTNLDCLILAGRVLIKLHRFDEAAERFSTVRQIDASDVSCLIGLGNCAAGKRDLEKSIEYYDMAAHLAPDYWASHYFKGVSLMDLKRSADGRASLQKCVALNPPAGICAQVDAILKAAHE